MSGKTVFVVDDQPEIRDLVASMLGEHGFQVLMAETAEECLAEARKRPETLHLLITDVILPGMSGLELGEAFEEELPHIPTLYMTGFEVPGLDYAPSIIRKPFTYNELIGKVKSTLELVDAV